MLKKEAADPYASREAVLEDTRKANYVNSYLLKNFTGDMMNSIDLVLRDYDIYARQQNLSPAQKSDYFLNLLDGPARTHFIQVYFEGMTFEEIRNIMLHCYNSNSRQSQVYSTLGSLRLDTVMTKHSLNSEPEVIKEIVYLIHRLTPKFPEVRMADANKVRFLRGAVFFYHWSAAPIGNITNLSFDFEKLYISLY